MEHVDNALGKDVDATPHDMAVIPPSAVRIYQRIIENFDRIEDMMTGVKAKEYGDPQVMCRRIGQVSFEYLNAASVKPYGVVGHYQNQNAPQPAVEVLP